MNQILDQNQTEVGHSFGAVWWVALLTFVVPLVVGGFLWYIVYLFYCRLRDIANETKRLRIAFVTVHSSTLGLKNSIQSGSAGSTYIPSSTITTAGAREGQGKSAVPPKPTVPPEDIKYLPKG